MFALAVLDGSRLISAGGHTGFWPTAAQTPARSSWSRSTYIEGPQRGHERALTASCPLAIAATVATILVRRGGRGACRAARQAPPRPPREDPTPFPRRPIFPPAAFYLLELLHSEDANQEDMVEALEGLQELHETDRHWGAFPAHVSECRHSAYNKGQLKIVQGILKCMEQSTNEDLRIVAIDTLLALMIGGCPFTRCPASFVVEAGAVTTLCKLANDTEDSSTLEILLELVRLAPEPMLPDIIEQGAVEACVKVLENSGASPMDQLSALNLLLALSKRAPAPVAQSRAYDAVKAITNVALIPRRNKIMGFLRPLVQHDGDVPPLTNIRTGGLRF